MENRPIFKFLAIFLIMSSIVIGCQPSVAPEQSEAPSSTQEQIQSTKPADLPEAVDAPFEPMSLTAPDCDYGGEFKSIEAIDQNTVKFTLCYPDAAFLNKILGSAFFIINKDDLDAAKGNTSILDQNPNGTGPWMFKEWVKGDHITLVANPNYYGEKAKVETFVIRWSEQAAQRLLELQAGTVDGIANVSPDDTATIQADPNLTLYPVTTINTFWLGFSNTTPPLDNVKVRKAIGMALNRQRIVDTYFPVGSIVAEGLIPPQLPVGSSDDTIPWYDYDIEAAKQLLAEAGYPTGFEIELSYRPTVRVYLPLPEKVAQEIQSQLGKIGITVKINQMESATFLDSWYAGNLPMVLIGGSIEPDATGIANWMFNDDQHALGNIYPEINQAALDAGQVSDPAERQALYDKFNQLIKDNVPMVPIAHGASALAFKKSVTGVIVSPVSTDFNLMDTGTGQLIYSGNVEPIAMVCNDVNDSDTYDICHHMYDALVAFVPGTVEYTGALAESWVANDTATEWTFTLRQGVLFHNGQLFDANDVVATFLAQWDASSPNHVGRTGTFDIFTTNFGTFLNAK